MKITRKIIVVFVLLISSIILLSFKADNRDKGVVVWENCGYVIVETQRYFVLVENYYSRDLREGDIIYGELHKYGFKEVHNKRKGTKQKLYIEDYWTNIDACFKWLKDNGKCDL